MNVGRPRATTKEMQMSSLEDVREGMDVVDVDGQKVGTVRFVKMGDPEAATAQGQSVGRRNGLIDIAADAFTGHEDPPREMQERLLRLGYIEVDATGLGGDFFVAADAVTDVTDTAVRLNTTPSDR
jgi:hypothetical protein